MLRDQIQADLTAIPIGKEKEKRELLKILLSEIKLKKGNNPSDEDVLAVLKKFKENAIECNNLSEIPILEAYLPQMLCDADVYAIIHNIIVTNNFLSPKDLGQVMSKLKDHKDFNLIDKKFASTVARSLLFT